MMPRYFGILFGSQGKYGWSEVYPIVATDYNNCATILATIYGVRLPLMATDASLIGARISDTDVKGDSFPSGLTFPAPGTNLATVTYNPQLALRLLFSAGALHRGSRWLRAIPDTQVSASGGYVPTAPWVILLGNYILALETSVSIATKIKGAVAPPFYTFTPITGSSLGGFERRSIGRPFGQPRGRRLVA